MKRPILPFFLIFGSLAAVYACSSSDNAGSSGTTNPEAGTNPEGSVDQDGNVIDPDGGPNPDGSVSPTTDPIMGTAAPKQVADAMGYADGPQWWQDTLYVTRPLDGFVEKVDLANGSVTEVTAFAAKNINGHSVDKNNALISAGFSGAKAESPGVYRTAPGAGVPTLITGGFHADGGLIKFDNPNDLVQHPSGVIFVTDPGYPPLDPPATVNHLISILNDGGAVAVDEFQDAVHPNGIAITNDGSTLYVSITSPILGTKPYIKKYAVSATGTLTAGTKFAELPHPTVDPAGPGATNDDPDGMAVDDNGNVYVAWRLGVNVYKADGTRYGAEPSIPLAAPNTPTNVGFGRADRKSLFITTASGKVFEAVLNVPGVLK